MAYRSWFQWFDTAGRTRLTRVDCPTSLQAGLVRINLQNISNAGLFAVTAASVGGPYTEPGSTTYPSVQDVLECTCQDTSGNLFVVNVPAPHTNLFESDGITAGGVFWDAWSAIMLANIVNPDSGLPMFAVISGMRKGPSTPSRY